MFLLIYIYIGLIGLIGTVVESLEISVPMYIFYTGTEGLLLGTHLLGGRCGQAM